MTEEAYRPPTPEGLSALGEIVRLGDPDRFEASLFAEEAARERLFALYAFNLELARASWRSQEPHIVLMRLQWWREVVEAALAGAPARTHEIAEPFSQAVQEVSADEAALEQMIAARELEANPEEFATRAGFNAYLDGSAGALTVVAGQMALGRALARDEAELCRTAGRAFGAARLFEATPQLAAHGRAFLPLPPSERAAILGGETTEEIRRLIREIAASYERDLISARKLARSAAPELRPVLLSGWRSARMLRAAQRPDLDVFRDFRAESPFRRRASLLWRAFSTPL